MDANSLKDQLSQEAERTYILSIRLTPNGFSFSIQNFLVDNSFYYENISFPSGSSYLNSLEEAIFKNELLLLPFKKTNIIIANDRFTLIPGNLYSENAKTRLYDFNMGDRKEHLLTDKLPHTDIVNIYGLQDDIHSFLMRTFATPSFYHHLSILSEYFSLRSKMGNSAKMICQIRDGIIDVCCFNKGQLQLLNTFPYKHVNDAAYFILNAWNNLGMDPYTDTLQLTGDISETQPLTAMLSSYLAEVVPVVFPAQLFSLGQETVLAHFDLIALQMCEF